MEHAPLIRQLNLADLNAFFQLRLRGLQAHPEAFGTSHQEALEKGPGQYEAILQGTQAADGNFILGAFATPEPRADRHGRAQTRAAGQGAAQGGGGRYVCRA